jgi:methylmalonyl-CoA epimerase
MKARKLDHVGIAVENLDEALKLYSGLLGLELAGTEVLEDQKVRTAFLPIGSGGASGESGSEIELLEAIDPESPIAKFISAKGAGVQHLAFRVDNIEEALAEAKAVGIRLIDETPRRGAGGGRIAFLHPKSTGGVLVELCERRHP